jgi:hypothetical protein
MDKPKLLRDDVGREVVVFTTPGGVHAIVDTSIPDDALRQFARTLQRKIRARELAQARAVLSGKRC